MLLVRLGLGFRSCAVDTTDPRTEAVDMAGVARRQAITPWAEAKGVAAAPTAVHWAARSAGSGRQPTAEGYCRPAGINRQSLDTCVFETFWRVLWRKMLRFGSCFQPISTQHVSNLPIRLPLYLGARPEIAHILRHHIAQNRKCMPHSTSCYRHYVAQQHVRLPLHPPHLPTSQDEAHVSSAVEQRR